MSSPRPRRQPANRSGDRLRPEDRGAEPDDKFTAIVEYIDAEASAVASRLSLPTYDGRLTWIIETANCTRSTTDAVAAFIFSTHDSSTAVAQRVARYREKDCVAIGAYV